MRLAGTTVELLPWRDCVDRYDRPHTFFYLDPPYWQTEGYGVPFAWAEYEALATVMRSLKGKAILSINDHPQIRECFSGLHTEVVDISYTIGGGDKPAERKELVIWSWDPASEPAGLF